MIKQMFKLIWNRKRNNFLMITGLFISFFVLFIALVTIGYNLNNYIKPLGYSYENVWKIGIDWKRMDSKEVKENLEQMESVLQSFPKVKSFAFSQCLLFMPGSSMGSKYEEGDKSLYCEQLSGGDMLPEVLGIKLIEGRWFNASDNAANREPVVINKYTKDEFFPDGQAIGRIITDEPDKEGNKPEYVVIGVIDEFRFTGEFSGSDRIVFHRLSLENERYSKFTNSSQFFFRILFRVSSDASIADEEKILKQLVSVAKGMTITIESLEEARSFANKTTLIFPAVLAVICGFLIFNVALGLFGMIWYRTNQRRAEIGLRRAVGATIKHIYIQIVGESFALSTMGIIIGSFFALQFPLLNLISFIETPVYYFAYTFSVVFIYLITVICAIYPGKIASMVQPAAALHYE